MSTGIGEAVAITGMACRFPGAASVDELWTLLQEGRDGRRVLTDDELARIPEAVRSRPSYVRSCMPIDRIEEFDAGFFGYTPQQATDIDPQHRLFLECAWEAFENAGYDVSRIGGAVGVFAGAGVGQYLMEHFARNEIAVAADHVLDAEKDLLCPRVSYKLGLTGPSVGIQTGCSTSLVAVHIAVQSLLRFECDVALAGGVSLKIPQRAGYMHVDGGILSPDGHCRAFDAAAQGTVPGSGVGAVVLKRHSDARSDGDHVWCVIRGSAVNNDGAVKVSFAAPNVHAQKDVIARALRVAGLAAADISYVEAHGTGTVLGDAIELAALSSLFAPTGCAECRCAVGSIKSNIGHLDAAAGVAGLIKAALCLKHRTLVPSLHVRHPNPAIAAPDAALYVNTNVAAWAADRGPRRAGVSAFGMGGTNAHVVLEEAPEPKRDEWQARDELLVFSGATPAARQALTLRYAAFLASNADLHLKLVALTTQTGRKGLGYRGCLVASSLDHAVTILRGGAGGLLRLAAGEVDDCRAIYVFPSSCGAGPINLQPLLEQEPELRRDLATCAELLLEALDTDLMSLVCPDSSSGVRPMTAVEQLLATFALQWGIARMLLAWGVRAAGYIGEGVGRLVADCVSGRVTLRDTVERLALELDELSATRGQNGCSGATQSRLLAAREDKRNVLMEFGCGQLIGGGLRDIEPAERGVAVLETAGNQLDRRQLLQVMGTYWLRGGSIEPPASATAGGMARVPLPPYPFERQRYWLPEQSGAGPSAASPARKDASVELTARGELEAALEEIWCEVLGIATISADDTFFDLGGDSLGALRVKTRIEEATGLVVPLDTFVSADLTIGKLASAVIGKAVE